MFVVFRSSVFGFAVYSTQEGPICTPKYKLDEIFEQCQKMIGCWGGSGLYFDVAFGAGFDLEFGLLAIVCARRTHWRRNIYLWYTLGAQTRVGKEV